MFTIIFWETASSLLMAILACQAGLSSSTNLYNVEHVARRDADQDWAISGAEGFCQIHPYK